MDIPGKIKKRNFQASNFEKKVSAPVSGDGSQTRQKIPLPSG
jgi:hypothetical protein